jgi:hypothetical protein
VTQVISRWQNFQFVKPDVLQAAADRGAAVHRHCAALLSGLWLPAPPAEIAGYLESFEAWRQIAVIEVLATEISLVENILGFQGHPDLICRLRNGDVAVVDFKTPVSVNRAWRLQLAAYYRLAEVNGYEVTTAFSLRLSPKGGSAKAAVVAQPQKDLAVFLAALAVHNFFHRA